jgi:hydroxymethylpyrimidine kinase/phosphomethylpyrimidine kinase/thiamine-phosphate diphosphorylase
MKKEIGLYPIVDSSHWLEKLLPLGVKTIQLRIKDKEGVELENEIKRSVALAKKYQANLFINDYWELAIRYNAHGVHLGQEDLDTANIEMIHNSGLYLGISTHSDAEVARAHALKPSYIAFGPIFPTTSKVMSSPAQGINQLKRLRHQLLNYPLVAIGGITLERLPEVLATHVDGIAVISAITQAEDPIAMTKKLMAVVV